MLDDYGEDLRSLGFGASLRGVERPVVHQQRGDLRSLGFGASLRGQAARVPLICLVPHLRSLGFGASLRDGRRPIVPERVADLRSLGFGASLRAAHARTAVRVERDISEVSASELH